MAKEAIKNITISKCKETTELCVSVELHAQNPGGVLAEETQRKKVRVVDAEEVLRTQGYNPGVCTSNPGPINNSAGEITGCWRFTDLDAKPKATASKRKPKTAKTA